MKLGVLLADLEAMERELADRYRTVGERHVAEHDLYHQCNTFARQCEAHAARLTQHGDQTAGHGGSRLPGRFSGAGELLLDLRALLLAAEEISITWVMIGQAAQALRDPTLPATVRDCHTETELQVKWLTTQIKTASPQALAVG